MQDTRTRNKNRDDIEPAEILSRNPSRSLASTCSCTNLGSQDNCN